MDAELLALMKRAGCHSIDFGIESGNDQILECMSKGITKDQATTAFRLCRELGIGAGGFFIIGMPGETEETVMDTIRFARELDCDVAGGGQRYRASRFVCFNLSGPGIRPDVRFGYRGHMLRLLPHQLVAVLRVTRPSSLPKSSEPRSVRH